MTAPPLPFVWFEAEKAFRPLPRVENQACAAYGDGEVVMLAPIEERSDATHRHEFAWLKEAWRNLPESIADDYPSEEHLRKRALIATGWCHVRDYPCTSRAEAQRWAANLRAEADKYAVVIIRDDVVRVCTAKSQARSKMKAHEFQASKTDVLEYVSTLLGVAPAQLERAAA